MTAEPLPDFDLYRELGVETGADAATIEAAYRALIKVHHPDVASDPVKGLQRGKRLNIARDWLTDPYRRRRYDRALGLDRPRLTTDWQPRPTSAEDLLRVRRRPTRRRARVPFGAIFLIGLLLMVVPAMLLLRLPNALTLAGILAVPVGFVLVVYGGVGLVVGLFYGYQGRK